MKIELFFFPAGGGEEGYFNVFGTLVRPERDINQENGLPKMMESFYIFYSETGISEAQKNTIQ